MKHTVSNICKELLPSHSLLYSLTLNRWAELNRFPHKTPIPQAKLLSSPPKQSRPAKQTKTQPTIAQQVASKKAKNSSQPLPVEKDGEVHKLKARRRFKKHSKSQREDTGSRFLAYDPDFIKMIASIPRDDSIAVVPYIKEWLAQGKWLSKEGVVAAMTKLRRWSRYSQALEVSEWIAREKPFELDEMDAINHIDLTARSGDLDRAEKLFKELSSDHKTERAYNSLLAVYCSKNLVERGEKLMEIMKEANLCSSAFGYNHMISLYIRNRLLDKLSLVLKELKTTDTKPDVFTYNILINYKSKAGNIEAVEKLMDELRANPKVVPNGATYTILANAYISADMREKAEAVLKEMELSLDAGRIKRRLLTYETLLTMYGTLGKLDGLERVWLHVKDAPQRTTASYVCMIEALGRIGEIHKAERIFKHRKKEGQNIGIRLYNAMLSGYSREGLMRKAEALIKELQRRGLPLDSLSYYHVVRGYFNTSEWDKALKVFREVKEIPEPERPNLWYDTYLTILKILCEKGDVINAKAHFEECRTLNGKDVRLYHYLLKACVNSRIPIDGFLEKMVADGIKPNEETEDLLKQLQQLVSTN